VKRQDDLFFSYRRLNLIGFILSGSALAYAALELEQVLGGIHCTLCTLVRLSLLCMSGIFLFAFLHNPWISGQRIYAFLNGLLALVGLSSAARYVWLDANPNLLAQGCTTGLPEVTHLLPEPLAELLNGPYECLASTEIFSGITLPHITLALFIILFVITWKLLFRRPTPRLFF
jgi:disulfide bond formation protein DsbB